MENMIANQQEAKAAVDAAAEVVSLDQWALAEARLLQTLRAAGCDDQISKLVITGDDYRLEVM